MRHQIEEVRAPFLIQHHNLTIQDHTLPFQATLPQISPSPLTFLKEPIGHPNWVHEVKHDGFRGILYVDRDQAWLVSRKGKKFRQFDPLLKQVTMLLISSG